MSDQGTIIVYRRVLIIAVIILLTIISFLSLWVRDLAVQLSNATDAFVALEHGIDQKPDKVDRATPDAAEDTSGVTETEKGVVSRLFEEDGKDKIEIDYIQMFIGNDGAQARIDDGDCTGTLEECWPDNNYYVRNENPSLKIFPIADDVRVLREDSTVPPVAGTLARTPVGLAEFRDYFENGSPIEGDPSIREPWDNTMYEVDIVSGEVAEIVWLFFP